MSDTRSLGEPLRRALIGARLRDIDVADSLGVDPKTVQRWLGGRVPHARHRWGVADLLSVHEYDLWPHLAALPSIDPEVYATYPHRGSVPREVWRQLFDAAEHEIGILVYSGLFIAEDVELVRLLGDKARAGADGADHPRRPRQPARRPARPRRRHPRRDGRQDPQRHRALPPATGGRRRDPTALHRALQLALPGDDEMLINQHIHGIAAAYAPGPAPAPAERRRRIRHLP